MVCKQPLDLVVCNVFLVNNLSFFQIFVPTLFEEHWSCYAFEPKDKILYLLVSIHDKFSTSKKNLDGAMVVLNIPFPSGNIYISFVKFLSLTVLSNPTNQWFFLCKETSF